MLGILGATANNGMGVAGACPSCSLAMACWSGQVAEASNGIYGLIVLGMQVINLSLGNPSGDCTSFSSLCDAIASADGRDLLLVAAAGNQNYSQPTSVPNFPARHPSVLAVGGVQNTNPSIPAGNWERWNYGSYGGMEHGSNNPGTDGVVGPARSIVSTVPAGGTYNTDPPYRCTDIVTIVNGENTGDESLTSNDGYGSCTGTSMATPHISALAGILRSINPRLSRDSIKDLIRASGSHYTAQTAQLGSGLPNARTAVDQTIAQTPNKLTPLFVLYSSGRLDYFYTSVPQMGAAATWGTLRPANDPTLGSRYVPTGGVGIANYGNFPGGYGSTAPTAEVWVFTTPENPKVPSVPLAPLYRLSWKCGEYTPYPPAVCTSTPNHMDTVYTADAAGVTAFQTSGYKLDGIEGYIYPKTIAQPPGTLRLMRKYNPTRDDHAIFPETALSSMTAQGYTQNSGSDWLGYVYPNTNGYVPSIN